MSLLDYTSGEVTISPGLPLGLGLGVLMLFLPFAPSTVGTIVFSALSCPRSSSSSIDSSYFVCFPLNGPFLRSPFR